VKYLRVNVYVCVCICARLRENVDLAEFGSARIIMCNNETLVLYNIIVYKNAPEIEDSSRLVIIYICENDHCPFCVVLCISFILFFFLACPSYTIIMYILTMVLHIRDDDNDCDDDATTCEGIEIIIL